MKALRNPPLRSAGQGDWWVAQSLHLPDENLQAASGTSDSRFFADVESRSFASKISHVLILGDSFANCADSARCRSSLTRSGRSPIGRKARFAHLAQYLGKMCAKSGRRSPNCVENASVFAPPGTYGIDLRPLLTPNAGDDSVTKSGILSNPSFVFAASNYLWMCGGDVAGARTAKSAANSPL